MKKWGWFITKGKKVYRKYDPEEETPDKVESKGIPTAENILPDEGSDLLTAEQKVGYQLQLGREFTRMSQVKEHMKYAGLRFAEAGDGVQEEADRIDEVTGHDHARDHHEARKKGIIPGLGGLNEKTFREKVRRRDYDA